jgi:hypothetical protein
MGDGTEFVATGAIEGAEGVGVPPMRELFAKARGNRSTAETSSGRQK